MLQPQHKTNEAKSASKKRYLYNLLLREMYTNQSITPPRRSM
jgi:hypothetical protein